MATSSAMAHSAVKSRKKVLHLVGSTKDRFYFDLSVAYCRACDGCPDLDRSRYAFLFAAVHLDGSWSFPRSLEDEALAEAKSMPIAEALSHIADIAPDVMVPHMFCVEGMTRYRSLFDLLRIPYLGNREYTVWPATDKAATKTMLAAGGVPVPKGELLVLGENEIPEITRIPCVVKPCNEDNSHGITLVHCQEDLLPAIQYAFSFDPRVVVEEYIAGREVRAAVIEEEDGSLTVLPKLEYFVKDIRTSAHKLATDDSGTLTSNPIVDAKRDGDRQCPADLSPELHRRIDRAVTQAHKALNCRHYGLFDIRINAMEEPFILEACLFCSFSPLSVIPSLAKHAGRDDLSHPQLFHSFLERAIAEGESPIAGSDVGLKANPAGEVS